jgi:hypothetical protein
MPRQHELLVFSLLKKNVFVLLGIIFAWIKWSLIAKRMAQRGNGGNPYTHHVEMHFHRPGAFLHHTKQPTLK